MSDYLGTSCIKGLLHLKLVKYSFKVSNDKKLAGEVQMHKYLYGKVDSISKEKNHIVNALRNIGKTLHLPEDMKHFFDIFLDCFIFCY